MQEPIIRNVHIAVACGISEGQICRHLHAGDIPLPDRRVGKSYFWRHETLANWHQGIAGTALVLAKIPPFRPFKRKPRRVFTTKAAA